jgi:flagellar hook-basal body complex protein FliE
MIDGVNNNASLSKVGSSSLTSAGKTAAAGGAGGASFSDLLKNSIDEVSRLQQDASQAVQDLATGKTEDVAGVMTAMEKSDLAFKTLLAIRGKLMDAYEEIKGISV